MFYWPAECLKIEDGLVHQPVQGGIEENDKEPMSLTWPSKPPRFQSNWACISQNRGFTPCPTRPSVYSQCVTARYNRPSSDILCPFWWQFRAVVLAWKRPLQYQAELQTFANNVIHMESWYQAVQYFITYHFAWPLYINLYVWLGIQMSHSKIKKACHLQVIIH